MKKTRKCFLSAIMVGAMAISMMPGVAFAEEGGNVSIDEMAQSSVRNEDELKSALSASTNSTITLEDNLTINDQLVVNGNHVLNLNGKILTSSANASAIIVQKDAVFELANGEFIHTGTTANTAAILSFNDTQTTLASDAKITASQAGIICGNSSTNAESNAILNVYGEIYCNDIGIWSQGGKNTVTVEGATIESNYWGIYQNGSVGDSSFTIKDSSISDKSETGTGIYISANKNLPKQTLVIENSQISGATGVEVKFTDVTISGINTKLTATVQTPTYNPSGNGSTALGYAFVLSHNGNESSADGAAGTVLIKDGSFEGLVDIIDPSAELVEATGSIEITGGQFSSDVNDFLAPGNTQDENGTVVIDNETAVASVNGVGYNDLQKAIDAANNGDIVTLVRNFTLDAPNDRSDGQGAINIKKNITIDGNGKTITAIGEGYEKDPSNSRSEIHVLNVDGPYDVTIKNLTIDGADKARSGINVFTGEKADGQANVNIQNVTVHDCTTYAVTNNGSNVTVDGLTSYGNGWGGINVDNKYTGKADLTVNSANISDPSSIVFDKGNLSGDEPSATINGGNFQYIVMNKGAEKSDLLINGGSFATDNGPDGAVDVSNYLADGLNIDAAGNVYVIPEYDGKNNYPVNIKNSTNGTVSVAKEDLNANAGETIVVTVTPDAGYKLDKLTVSGGVDVTDNEDGTYSFTMPASAVTITATFVEDPDYVEPTPEPEPTPDPTPSMPFTDVNEGDWFYDVVQYAYDNGLMTGTSVTTFEPNTSTTRGMIVAVLNRLEGGPTAEAAGFTDVNNGDWYADAVNWAASVGIVNGFEDNTFRANDPITREQMAAILYNYADYKGYDVSERADLSSYADADSISNWALDTLEWANAEGLITGMSADTIAPQGQATRAQVAAMFQRFLTAEK